MHLNPSRNQIFAKCQNTIKEAMFRILNFKICKDFDQSSNINLVALYFPLQLLGSQKFARSDKIFGGNRPMKMVQRCCARVSRVSSQAAAEPSPLPPLGRRTPPSLSPRARASLLCILAPDTPPTGARAAVALPRDHTSRRQGHWPSPLRRPILLPPTHVGT